MNPWLEDASSLADAIRRGEIRSADAVEASLSAIEDSDLNTVAYLDAEGALAAAEEALPDVAGIVFPYGQRHFFSRSLLF